MTLDYAVSYCEAIKRIRRDFPEKFIWVDQGDTVQCPNGVVGTITTIIYNPVRDTYFIVVSKASVCYITTDPHELSIITPRPGRYL